MQTIKPIIVTKVAVILTSFNRDWLLEQAIESVLKQTFTDYHLYIVDDASDNPETIKILKKYESRNNITVHWGVLTPETDRYARVGYSIGINRVLAMCSCPYITYLTCDDKYFHDRLERMVAHLDDNPDHHIVFGIQALVDIVGVNTFKSRGTRAVNRFVSEAACRVDHNSVMHRRVCFDVICKDNGRLPWYEEAPYLGAADAHLWERFNKHWAFYRIKGLPTDEHRFHTDSLQDRMNRGAF